MEKYLVNTSFHMKSNNCKWSLLEAHGTAPYGRYWVAWKMGRHLDLVATSVNQVPDMVMEGKQPQNDSHL